MALAPGTVVAGFVIERELGAGGMGVVYLARHPRLPRHVALKLLRTELGQDATFADRFRREADTVAQLDHPNIVAIDDAGAEDGRLWISMRYIDGSTADLALAGYEWGMPPARAVHIVEKVAAALDHAHRHRVVHRDVKPANILLAANADGTRPGTDGDQDWADELVYLSDFGVAKGMGEFAAEETALTRAGNVVATIDYAAPEQILGQPLDGRCDQFALGCVLFKLLTGVVPYGGENLAAKVYARLHRPPPHPTAVNPDLPRDLDDVLARALALDPVDRYPSCRALAAAARAALASAPPAVVEEPAAAPDPDDTQYVDLIAPVRPAEAVGPAAPGGAPADPERGGHHPPDRAGGAAPVRSALPPARPRGTIPGLALPPDPFPPAHLGASAPARPDGPPRPPASVLSRTPPPVRRSRRRGWWLVAALVLVAGAGATTIVLTSGGIQGQAGAGTASPSVPVSATAASAPADRSTASGRPAAGSTLGATVGSAPGSPARSLANGPSASTPLRSTAVTTSAAPTVDASFALPALAGGGLPAATAVISMAAKTDAGQPGFALFLVDTDHPGSAPVQISDARTEGQNPILTPDRTTVVYIQGDTVRALAPRHDGNGDRPLFTGDQIGCAHMYRPALDPAKPELLAVPCQPQDGGPWEIRLTALDGSRGAVVRDAHLARVDDVSFSADGSRVAFWGSADLQAQGGRIYTQSTSGHETTATPVTTSATGGDPDWSPATGRIVYSDQGHLFSVDAAHSGTPTKLTDGATVDSGPCWSPDGSEIIFKRHPAGQPDRLYLVPAAGGTPSAAVTDPGFAGTAGSPIWGNR